MCVSSIRASGGGINTRIDFNFEIIRDLHSFETFGRAIRDFPEVSHKKTEKTITRVRVCTHTYQL